VVDEDVAVLAEYGIVKFQRDGQSKQPFVPYETIAFDITIRMPLTGGDMKAPT
jgi:predicted transcriptional regulator